MAHITSLRLKTGLAEMLKGGVIMDVVPAVKHMRQIVSEMKALTVMGDEELYAAAKNHQAPYELVRMVARAPS